MNKNNKYWALSLLFMFVMMMGACSDDDGPNNSDDGTGTENPATEGKLQVEIDGVEKECTSCIGSLFNGNMSISVSFDDNSGINITLNDYSEEGDYTLNTSNLTSYNVTINEVFTSFTGSTGTLTIDEVDTANKTLTGSFSFTGINLADQIPPQDKIEATKGFFNKLPY